MFSNQLSIGGNMNRASRGSGFRKLYKAFVYPMCFFYTSAFAVTYDFSSVSRLLADSLEVIAGNGGGCALLIVHNDSVIYDSSFALPGKSFSKDKIVPIASASKWLSAGVIMALVDEGKLSLDSKISTHVPAFTGEKAGITIRQLFSHTSGLPGGLNDASCLNSNEGTLEACADQIASLQLIATPGSALSYGGNSMQACGRVAEVVSGIQLPSGQCWDTLFARSISHPLSMTHTAFDLPPLYSTENPRVPGGAISNASDYMRYLRMLLNKGVIDGKRVLSQRAIDTMLCDQTRGASIIYTPYLIARDLDSSLVNTRYGIGNWCEVVDKSGRVIESGSQGKFGFSPWIDRQRNLAGILTMNNDFVKAFPTYYQLRKLIRNIVPVSGTPVKVSLSSLQQTRSGTPAIYTINGRRLDSSRMTTHTRPGLILISDTYTTTVGIAHDFQEILH
jgi:serine-type D-Ala-D-Ala carboxypeptidase/endopeptidase